MEQITFEEKEIADMRDFINFVAANAKYELNTPDIFKYSKLYSSAVKTLKKMDDHVLELKQVIEAKDKQ